MVRAKAEEQTADGSGEVAVEGKGSAKSTEKPVSYTPHPQLEHYREHFRAVGSAGTVAPPLLLALC
jgi:hypothetical protein